MTEEMKEMEWWKNPVKYFAHGLLFLALFLLLNFVWAFIWAVLMMVGAFIGVVIGFLILLLIVGGLNSFLTDKLWFPVITSWKTLLFHGFVLLVALVVADFMLSALYNRFLPSSIATRVFLFIITTVVNGYLAKNVARLCEEKEEQRLAKPYFHRPTEPFIRYKIFLKSISLVINSGFIDEMKLQIEPNDEDFLLSRDEINAF